MMARTLQCTPPLYHLYMELNKAFNLVLLKASSTLLCGYRLPKQLVSSIGKAYAYAHDYQTMPRLATINGKGSDMGVMVQDYTCTLSMQIKGIKDEEKANPQGKLATGVHHLWHSLLHFCDPHSISCPQFGPRERAKKL